MIGSEFGADLLENTLAGHPTLTSLRAFVAVGQSLSFTKAAEKLCVTQSAVSRQVRHLEVCLDIDLFRRIGNDVFFTDKGHEYFEHLGQAFELIEAATEQITSTFERQKISILAPPTFASRWLARQMSTFRNSFPDIDLTIHTHVVKDARYDCVVRYGTGPAEKHVSYPLFMEQHVGVCAPEIKIGSQEFEQTCLLHVLDEGDRLPNWENWLAATQIYAARIPPASLEFSSLDLVIHATVTGAGLAIVDRNMIKLELENGSLNQFDPTIVSGPYGYWLDIPKQNRERARVPQFLRWLSQRAK